jgi:hypothetical protein
MRLSSVGLLALLSCSEDSLFGGGTLPGDGGGGSGAAGPGPGPSSVNAGGGPSSSSATGGGGATSSSSSAVTSTSTGPMGCAHAPCDEGATLDPMCDPCVGSICAEDPYCCQTAWDHICVGHMWAICQQDCGMGGSCDDQYAEGTQGYYLCVQGEECLFGFNATLHSCATVCQTHGGECITAYNNNGQCGIGQEVGCNSMMLTSGLCECSRGCGGGPACMNGQICMNGQCL